MRGLSASGLAGGGKNSTQRKDVPHRLVLASQRMTTEKRRISAMRPRRQLGLRRYETAWMMLHNFRRAMVDVGGEPLRGEVEVDDTYVGGT